MRLSDALREFATFQDRTDDPATPASGSTLLYVKDGKIHSIDDQGAVTEYGPGGGAGNGIQVVQAVKTDTFTQSLSGSQETGDIPGLTPSITPSSATAKIKVEVSLNWQPETAGSVGFTLFRDGARIFVGDTAGSRSRVSAMIRHETPGGYRPKHVSFSFVDEPGTTDEVTYSIRCLNLGTQSKTLYINRGEGDSDNSGIARGASSLIVTDFG
jgi:hypothetical protein